MSERAYVKRNRQAIALALSELGYNQATIGAILNCSRANVQQYLSDVDSGELDESLVLVIKASVASLF